MKMAQSGLIRILNKKVEEEEAEQSPKGLIYSFDFNIKPKSKIQIENKIIIQFPVERNCGNIYV